MDQSKRPDNKFYVRFGDRTTLLLPFSNQTHLAEIEDHVRRQFGAALPDILHIEFYSWKAKKTMVLNEEVLRSEYSPFSVDIFDNDEIVESIMIYPELVVSDDSNSHSVPNRASNVSCNGVSNNENTTSMMMQTEESQSNQNVLDNNIAQASSEVEEEGDDDHPSVDTKAGSTERPLASPSTSSPSSNDGTRVAGPSDEQISQLGRLRLYRDVEKCQKDNYLSNTFSIGQGSAGDGKAIKGTSLVQGVKDKVQKGEQVLPILQGLQQFQNKADAVLCIYGVHEEVSADGRRIWYTHRDKSFLWPKDLQPNATPENPIKLNLKDVALTADGKLPLKFYMMTKWDKIKTEEVLYKLDEANTLRIHPALHQIQPSGRHIPPVRLLFVVYRAGGFDWERFCLSDFIQPPLKSSPQSSTNEKRTQADEPNAKKQKQS